MEDFDGNAEGNSSNFDDPPNISTPAAIATSLTMSSIREETPSNILSEVDSFSAWLIGTVCRPDKIISNESSSSSSDRLCLILPLPHRGKHCKLSVTKLASSTFPRKVTANVWASLVVTSAEHWHVPLNSRAKTTGNSATKIDGIVVGL
jgi:hypothetical protein